MTTLVRVGEALTRPADFESDPFELRLDARRFRGWTEVAFSSSIEEAVRTLSVKLIGAYQDDIDEQVTAGDLVSAWVGKDRLFSGYAETFSDESGPDSESLSIECRSKTCDLVDCSAPVKSWSNIRLDKLVAALCDGFAVSIVFAEAAAAAKLIRKFRTTAGETVFAALDRLAKEQGLLVTDDETGRLVITRAAGGSAGTSTASSTSGSGGDGVKGPESSTLTVTTTSAGRASISTTRLVRGRNILASSGTWDLSGRFSAYTVKGQTITDLDVDASAVGDASDPGITRYRPLVIIPEKGVDRQGARDLARWEAVTRAGNSLRVSVTLAGWRQDDGTLWRPNQLVRVTDRRKRLLDATLLITRVAMTLSAAGGRKTVLDLAPAAGFTPYVPGVPILEGAGRWFGEVEGTTRPDAAELRKLGAQ